MSLGLGDVGPARRSHRFLQRAASDPFVSHCTVSSLQILAPQIHLHTGKHRTAAGYEQSEYLCLSEPCPCLEDISLLSLSLYLII